MPELPDVEALRKYLRNKALHKKIKRVEVKSSRMVKSPAYKLKKELKDQEFQNTDRVGKNLLVEIKEDKWLVMHFGMTGGLEYYSENRKVPDYAAVLFHFTNNHCLAFKSRRKFGSLQMISNPEQWKEEKKLGPDALDLKQNEFLKIVKKKSSKIKTVLMDQKNLAGIGNIYADEILFQAEIHPETRVADLNDQDIKTIFQKMKYVLKKVIEKNADPEKIPGNFLLHYREKGSDCPGCSGKIEKTTLSGRSTYFCTECQKKANKKEHKKSK